MSKALRIAGEYRLHLAVLALSAAPLAGATTFNIPSGDNTTLKNDLAAAKPGDVLILNGAYTTGITTSTNGTAAAPITVEAGPGGASLNNTTGTGEGIEVNNNYYVFQGITINGFQESFRTFGASYGIANNITCNNSKIESFKLKNTSTHWLVENCTVNNAGMEGYYCGDADQNWTGGVPDQTSFVTFYHDKAFQTFNDGFDSKEGTHDIRIIDSQVDWNNTVPGGNNEGDSGFYDRVDRAQVINLTTLNNGSVGNHVRANRMTAMNGVTYGSATQIYGGVANNMQGAFLSTNHLDTALYKNYSLTNVAGGLLESGSHTPTQPAPSTFVETTWTSAGGAFDEGAFLPINMNWDNSASAVGDGATWDYNQQNFDDVGVNGNIPAMFFQGVNVTFNDADNGHYAVTLGASVSPGAVTVSSTGNYTFSGTGAITGAATLTKSGTGTLTLNNTNTYTGATNVQAGKLVVGTSFTTGSSISVSNGATAQLGGTGTRLQTQSLNLNATGKLDLTTNSLDIHYLGGTSPNATVRTYVARGYNGGTWTGTGLTSSTAAVDTIHHAIGYADGADNVVQGLAAGDELVKYTFAGDANLDGKVDVSDLGILASHYGQTSGAGWDGGDFTYDSKVDVSDLGVLASNYGAGTGATGAAASAQFQADLKVVEAEDPAFAAAVGAVPEPGTFTFAATSAVALLVRRRRRN